jgi:hypothetical protein
MHGTNAQVTSYFTLFRRASHCRKEFSLEVFYGYTGGICLQEMLERFFKGHQQFLTLIR